MLSSARDPDERVRGAYCGLALPLCLCTLVATRDSLLPTVSSLCSVASLAVDDGSRFGAEIKGLAPESAEFKKPAPENAAIGFEGEIGASPARMHTYRYTHTDTHVQTHTYRYTRTDSHVQIHTYRQTHTDTHIQRHAYTPGQGVLSAGDVLQQNTFVALQHTATHCNALQHIATRCTATHCNALQHTATLCNTLQHTATLVCVCSVVL